MATVQTEQVLVVPTKTFYDCGYFQGFCRDAERYLTTLLDPAHTRYLPRDQMELDPSFKQLIPYCVFRHVDEEGQVYLFQYRRGSGQGESRLHEQRSIGIGGHISTLDDHADSVYHQGMARELEEEVQINSPYSEKCVGLINDDSNDVGKVHLGVVHLFDVETPDVLARESDIESAGFELIESLLADIDRFETWSQICLRALG